MGHSRHRSLVSWLALLAASAAAGSGLLIASASAVSAQSDVIVVFPDSGTSISDVTEGFSSGDTLIGQFVDSANLASTDCNAHYDATIKWGDGQTDTGTVSCDDSTFTPPGSEVQLQVFDVTGSHRYADSGSYTINLAVSDTSENASSSDSANTDSAAINDAAIRSEGDNQPEGGFSKVEGAPVAISVDFVDAKGQPSLDSGITTTVDWGDGSAVQTVTPTDVPIDCSCSGFNVAASHNYDANKPSGGTYTITVTAKDDGGSTQTVKMTAKVADAVLTAGANKSASATATKAFTATLGSFSDAAGSQATASDFSARINWGDSSTSSGTVSAGSTAGTFITQGTHTYASTGTKSVTITVTDEEGQTVTLKATVTVGAAPIVLPQTGSPTQQPASPLPYLALMLLGLIGLAAGIVRGTSIGSKT